MKKLYAILVAVAAFVIVGVGVAAITASDGTNLCADKATGIVHASASCSSKQTEVNLPSGPRGQKGVDGKDGTKGAPGARGTKGATGTAGTAGPAGVAGPQGVAGPAGATGVAGPAGPAGVAGAKGATGATGAAGVAGVAGAAGPAGPAGADGVSSPLVFGPYNAVSQDSSRCGATWAVDTYTVTFVVSPESDGSFDVAEYMHGGFVTNAGGSPEDCTVTIAAGITGSFYGDYAVTVPAGSDFNPTATLDNSTPCGATCTSNEFYSAFFAKTSLLDTATYAWQFHYKSAGSSWSDTDHGDTGNITS